MTELEPAKRGDEVVFWMKDCTIHGKIHHASIEPDDPWIVIQKDLGIVYIQKFEMMRIVSRKADKHVI